MWKAMHWSIWATNSQNMDLISQRYLTKRKNFFTEMLLPLQALKVTCNITCSSLAHHKENPEEQKKKHHDSVSRSTTQQRLIAWLVWRTDGVTRPRPAFRPQCKLPSAACPLIRLAFTVSAAEHCRQRNGWLDVPMCTIFARNGYHCYCSGALNGWFDAQPPPVA